MVPTSPGDGNNNEGVETEAEDGFYESESGTRWVKPDEDLGK